jgi:hypothetical protein
MLYIESKHNILALVGKANKAPSKGEKEVERERGPPKSENLD